MEITKAESVLLNIYVNNASGGTLNRNRLMDLSGFSKKKVNAVMIGLTGKDLAIISISRGAGWMLTEEGNKIASK